MVSVVPVRGALCWAYEMPTDAEVAKAGKATAKIYLASHPGYHWCRDEIMSDSLMAAHKASKKWNGKGAFSGYAFLICTYGILDGVRDRATLSRTDHAKHNDSTKILPAWQRPLALTYDYDKISSDDPYAASDMLDLVNRLPRRQREVILWCDIQDRSQGALARLWNVTPSRVCQIRTLGLEGLRRMLVDTA